MSLQLFKVQLRTLDATYRLSAPTQFLELSITMENVLFLVVDRLMPVSWMTGLMQHRVLTDMSKFFPRSVPYSASYDVEQMKGHYSIPGTMARVHKDDEYGARLCYVNFIDDWQWAVKYPEFYQGRGF